MSFDWNSSTIYSGSDNCLDRNEPLASQIGPNLIVVLLSSSRQGQHARVRGRREADRRRRSHWRQTYRAVRCQEGYGRCRRRRRRQSLRPATVADPQIEALGRVTVKP